MRASNVVMYGSGLSWMSREAPDDSLRMTGDDPWIRASFGTRYRSPEPTSTYAPGSLMLSQAVSGRDILREGLVDGVSDIRLTSFLPLNCLLAYIGLHWFQRMSCARRRCAQSFLGRVATPGRALVDGWKKQGDRARSSLRASTSSRRFPDGSPHAQCGGSRQVRSSCACSCDRPWVTNLAHK